jgi:outer membrane protein
MQRRAMFSNFAPLGRARRSVAAIAGTAALCAGVAVLGIPAGPVVAQESRLGFVNTERVLRESNPAKASQQKLEQEFAKREKSIQDSATKLKDLTAKLERDAAVMPEAERIKRQREAAELERDIQRRQREFREDLNQRRNEELAGVVERANRVIRQIAEAEKFDIIFQEAVYASPRIDITDKVLRALNAAPAAAR